MKQGVKEKIEVPDDVDVSIEGKTVSVEGPNAELTRTFDILGISIRKEEGDIFVESESSRKKQVASVGTVVSHINNMLTGVTDGFTSKLKVVYSHFPINVSVSDEGVVIENYIGEEKPRIANIVGSSEVEIQGEEIVVKGPDKEEVGQTAANIEQTTSARGRDPRVFQDGIYVVEKV